MTENTIDLLGIESQGNWLTIDREAKRAEKFRADLDAWLEEELAKLNAAPAQDAWNEELHPRGQPENKGEFAKSPGGGGATPRPGRRRRFKNAQMQKTYDAYRGRGFDPEKEKTRGSAGNAYYVGRVHHRVDHPFAQPGSIAYAAWAAGIDDWMDAEGAKKPDAPAAPKPSAPMPGAIIVRGGYALERPKGSTTPPAVSEGHPTESEIKDLYDRVAKPDGGFTYQPVLDIEPTEGFAVSPFPDRSFAKPAAEFAANDLVDYIHKNQDMWSDVHNHIGAWNDPDSGKVFLDVSVVSPDQATAERLAREHDQIAVFDLKTFQTIVVNREATSGGVVGGEAAKEDSQGGPDG